MSTDAKSTDPDAHNIDSSHRWGNMSLHQMVRALQQDLYQVSFHLVVFKPIFPRIVIWTRPLDTEELPTSTMFALAADYNPHKEYTKGDRRKTFQQ